MIVIINKKKIVILLDEFDRLFIKISNKTRLGGKSNDSTIEQAVLHSKDKKMNLYSIVAFVYLELLS